MKNQISATVARQIVDACVDFARNQAGGPGTYAIFVLAPNGDIVDAHVMDGVLPIGVETGLLKAKTALYARTPSSAVAQRFSDVEGRVIRLDLGKESGLAYYFVGGGLPIVVENNLIGAIGVGGGNMDEQCAYQALTKVLGPQPPLRRRGGGGRRGPPAAAADGARPVRRVRADVEQLMRTRLDLTLTLTFDPVTPFPDHDIVIVQTLNGLFSAALLFLIASGLTLAFGVMRIVNIAHGSFYMLGVYVAYTWRGGRRACCSARVAVVAVVGAVGFLMQRFFLRRFASQPLAQMMMTMGFALFFRDAALDDLGRRSVHAARLPRG